MIAKFNVMALYFFIWTKIKIATQASNPHGYWIFMVAPEGFEPLVFWFVAKRSASLQDQHRLKILRIAGNQFIVTAVPFPLKDCGSPFRAVNMAKHTGFHSVFVNNLFEYGILFRRIKWRIMERQYEIFITFFFRSIQ